METYTAPLEMVFSDKKKNNTTLIWEEGLLCRIYEKR